MVSYSTSARRRGFTMVELMVVIVVIAILAAITIASYNLIQRRAHDSARLTEAGQIKKSIMVSGKIDTVIYDRPTLISTYNLASLSPSIYCMCDNPYADDFYSANKSKIYINPWHEDGHTFFDIIFYSYAQGQWIGYTVSKFGVQNQIWGSSPPFIG